MRWLVVLAIVVGCRGDGMDGGPHWVFMANVNAGIGEQHLDLSAGARMDALGSGVEIFGDDRGSCDHTFDFRVPAPLAVQTYTLAGWTGTAIGVYTDCRFGNMSIVGSGAFTVNRADASCPQPPCIDAGFYFSWIIGEPQGFTAGVGGSVSNY